MKKVLLIDVDSKIPNLALMKLSTYYKDQGYDITIWRFGFSGYQNEHKGRKVIDARKYGKVFVSIIFKCNKNIIKVINCDNVEFGGSGYDVKKKLPLEIDQCDPDYSIYPDNNKSYGFITRGCIRNCNFCIVPKKEGTTHFSQDIEQIIKHKEVVFLDNNFLSYKDHKLILKRLIDKKIKCSFNQGLDIRLINDDNARLLSRLNYYPLPYTFAFDDIKLLKTINDKLLILRNYISGWNIRFYIYCNAKMDIINEIMSRINWCKENQCLPYLMRDEDCYNSENKSFYSDLSAWCNQPSFFKKVDFKGFMLRRTSNKIRQHKHTTLALYRCKNEI